MQREITKRPWITVVTTTHWSTTNQTHLIFQTRVTRPTTAGGSRLANSHSASSQASVPKPASRTPDPSKARAPKEVNARIANQTSAPNPRRQSRKRNMGRAMHCQTKSPNLANRTQNMMTTKTHKRTRATPETEGEKEKDARRRETSYGSTRPGMMQLRPTSGKGF